ncbi:MAG: LON peptidase substrate-binding domain-containing protein [Thiohalomonadaceae bacterium]
MDAVVAIPLFPLHTVLFPGGPLALRVFEPRYLDMIGRVVKDGGRFGICLIAEGEEIGEAAFTYDVGTLAHISYWHKRADGMLGVTVVGDQRFRILEREVQPDQLITAKTELIPNETPRPLPAEFRTLAVLLEEILTQLGHPYVKLPKHYDDASWVGARLAELLPIQLAQKQLLLQLDDPIERLDRLRAMIELGELA